MIDKKDVDKIWEVYIARIWKAGQLMALAMADTKFEDKNEQAVFDRFFDLIMTHEPTEEEREKIAREFAVGYLANAIDETKNGVPRDQDAITKAVISNGRKAVVDCVTELDPEFFNQKDNKKFMDDLKS